LRASVVLFSAGLDTLFFVSSSGVVGVFASSVSGAGLINGDFSSNHEFFMPGVVVGLSILSLVAAAVVALLG
jgi:hypothetical protein